MASFKKEVIDNIVEKDEEIIDKVINPRKINSMSAHIYLTDNRLIYHNPSFLNRLLGVGKKYSEIELSSIEDLSYMPKPLHSGGLIEVYTDRGEKYNLTPSFVGEKEAERFIESARSRL